MTIKMVATDVDGTILRYSGEFTPEVIDCIKSLDNNGIKVVIVTGRMHKSAKKIADQLGLKNAIVSYQGALVRENTTEQETLYERHIPTETAFKIIDWAHNENIHMNLYMNDNLYVEKEDEITHKYAEYQKIPFTAKPFSELELDNINKLVLIDYDNPERVTRLTKKLQEDFPELFIVKSCDFFCEVCHKEATKGDGLRALQKLYGISQEETLTIGDHNNDIDLLKAGGVKVAMGNGTDELKAVADYVTDTVDNNGFVRAIEKFVKVGANV